MPIVASVVNQEEQARLFQKYVTDLTALYGSAKANWFIDPFKTIEEYHFDLLQDWESGAIAKTLCRNFFDFPVLLKAKFDQQEFFTIKELSPRAHPKETLAPVEVVFAFVEIEKAMAKVEIASHALDVAHQVSLAPNHKLAVERARLQQNTVQIGALLANNEDRIRQALLARIKAKQNQ